MLLPFSTNINNKPTYFVEKIWAGFALNQIDTSGVRLEHIDRAYYEIFGDSPFDYESDFKPKLHTIRRDVHDRWKQGMLKGKMNLLIRNLHLKINFKRNNYEQMLRYSI
ncbi:hypothetical protein [Elizabethkingia miricola]|uniref:hypothetical protein n=1 Tax=Elizabethkingia miricola TaxID=172045 RepID=UPI001F2EB335|nr:hypothetical protein [Elizabethkingia miricola]UIO97020.1 hypothetical protein LYZ41_02805 [Elizabethkingia miricola]WER13804.1 hypothetical protein P0M31_02820 [Elizabethkingia miricola]WGL73980.1 hypothetical protein QFB80_02810 [Elizabethkingia miricola]WNG65708.1 hypothetical protein M9H57_02805 [Elizabethkingia miricola]